jgi:hypothetical protein
MTYSLFVYAACCSMVQVRPEDRSEQSGPHSLQCRSRDAVSGQRVRRLGQVVVRGIGDAHAVGLGFTPSTRANWIRLSISAYTKITLDTHRLIHLQWFSVLMASVVPLTAVGTSKEVANDQTERTINRRDRSQGS